MLDFRTDLAADATTAGVIAAGAAVRGTLPAVTTFEGVFPFPVRPVTRMDRDWYAISMVAGTSYTIVLDGDAAAPGRDRMAGKQIFVNLTTTMGLGDFVL